jgi:hypothetical protein
MSDMSPELRGLLARIRTMDEKTVQTVLDAASTRLRTLKQIASRLAATRYNEGQEVTILFPKQGPLKCTVLRVNQKTLSVRVNSSGERYRVGFSYVVR